MIKLRAVQELRPGLWTWTAPHPEWSEKDGGPDGWDREVRSYAYDSGGCLLLFDPIAPPTLLLENLVEAKEVAVLLTCKWHSRDAQQIVEQYGAHVHLGPESDELPAGVETRPGAYGEEVLFWIPAHGAIVAGDALLGREHTVRVQPDSWLGEGQTHESLREALRPLLELPVAMVLPAHGDPVVEDAHDALRGALDT